MDERSMAINSDFLTCVFDAGVDEVVNPSTFPPLGTPPSLRLGAPPLRHPLGMRRRLLCPERPYDSFYVPNKDPGCF